MEEKKLTDEEIANAIVQSIEYSKTITYFDEWGNCKSIFMTDILDLIHRLQSENATLESELKKELDEHEEFTKKAKDEIERLKEKFSISHYRDSWKNKFFKAQEEVERLTEELDLANETIDRNNKRYEKVSIERQKALDRVDFLEDALLDKIRRNEEIITVIKQAEQQAVKETAKEILGEVAYEYTEDMGYTDWLEDCYFGGAMERLCKKYGLKAIQTKKGVEVE